MNIYESDFEGLLYKDFIMLSHLGPKDAPTIILVSIKMDPKYMLPRNV